MSYLNILPEEILDYIWFLAHNNKAVNNDINILSVLWEDMNKNNDVNFIDYITIFKINNNILENKNINIKNILVPSQYIKLGHHWQKLENMSNILIEDFQEYYPEYITEKLPINLNKIENTIKLMRLLKYQ